MRSSTLRLVSIVIVFVAALVGGLVVMRGMDDGSSNGNASGGKSGAADIWKVGDTWTVQVKQDGGAISPDGDASVAKIPFRFKVDKAPSTAEKAWTVKVTQDGAEGPFAAGWRLYYVERDGVMELSKVAMGGAQDTPLEAELATIVLGSQFPYEVRYTTAPKDMTITAADLIERSALPPSSAVPGSDGTGGPKGAPTAPPIDQAVAPSSTPAAPKR